MSDKPTTQTTVVEHESAAEQVIEGKVDTLDSKARYLAYAGRLRTALVASSRYLAYTSEVGEAFRPIVPPFLVTAAYGISWAYLGLDVAYEGYKTHHAGKDNAVIGTTMVKRGVFQALASMALPAFTVHSVVKYSVIGFKNVKNVKVKAWGPTLLGLSVVPFLPYIFDEPVEHIVDRVFEPIEKMVTSESIARLGHNKAGDELPIVEEDKKVVLESKKDQ